MSNSIIILIALIFLLALWFGTRRHIPKNAQPLVIFDAKKYLGTWYEIARFDYRFEKDMDNVVAQYSPMPNGEIKVFNSGYHLKKQEWKSVTGSAKFRVNETIGALMVTFFKPFYAGYNVVAVDDNYKYALVMGSSLSYLWLLSKEQTMPEAIKQKYLKIAEDVGYDTSKLIWVKHDKENPFVHAK